MEDSNISSNLKARRIRRLVFIVLILGLIIFVSRYGIISVQLGSTFNNKEATIKISGPSSKYFTLKPNSKKTMLVRRGEYSVKATNDTGLTRVNTSLGLIGYKKIDVAVDAPKVVEAIGTNKASCAAPSTDRVLFYNCHTTDELVSTTIDGTNYSYNKEQGSVRNYTVVVKPYMDGYLSFTPGTSKLIITKTVTNGKDFTNSGTKSIEYSGAPSHGLASTDLVNTKSTRFTVFDKSKAQLQIYNDLDDNSPVLVDFKGKIDLSADSNIYVKLYGDRAVIYNAFVVDEGVVSAPKGAKQKAFTIDSTSGAKLTEYTIDISTSISDLAFSNGGRLLLESSSIDKDGIAHNRILEISGKKTKHIALYGQNTTNPCWKDNDNFYYVADNYQILIYNFKDSSSKLAYGLQDNQVLNLSCYMGALSFSAVSPTTDHDNGVDFYYLTDIALSGERLEDLLPLGAGAISDINNAYSFKNKLYVDLIRSDTYIPGLTEEQYQKLVPPNAAEHKKNAVDYFKRQGIDVNKYNFIFNY